MLVSGELGAGKTTFVRGALRSLGVEGPITSPTFVVGHLHDGRDGPVAHLDLYRLAGMGGEDPGLLDPFFGDDAIVFVEWPEHAEDAWPDGARATPRPARTRGRRHAPDRGRVIVGLDTSTSAVSVAVVTPAGEFERHDEPDRPRHAQTLQPLLEQVLTDAGAGWGDVERICVGIGPGGFTGLRLGIATARALAQAATCRWSASPASRRSRSARRRTTTTTSWP